MAEETAPKDSPSLPTGGDAASRIQDIRARMAELHRRIKTERDPMAVSDLRAEIDKLSELISELVGEAHTHPVEKADMAWPADLNVESAGPSAWGADPVEVIGG